MTACNKCGGPMVPYPDAIVPALGCVNCKRVIPLTRAQFPKAGKAELNRALRAARRLKMRQEASA